MVEGAESCNQISKIIKKLTAFFFFEVNTRTRTQWTQPKFHPLALQPKFDPLCLWEEGASPINWATIELKKELKKNSQKENIFSKVCCHFVHFKTIWIVTNLFSTFNRRKNLSFDSFQNAKLPLQSTVFGHHKLINKLRSTKSILNSNNIC